MKEEKRRGEVRIYEGGEIAKGKCSLYDSEEILERGEKCGSMMAGKGGKRRC